MVLSQTKLGSQYIDQLVEAVLVVCVAENVTIRTYDDGIGKLEHAIEMPAHLV